MKIEEVGGGRRDIVKCIHAMTDPCACIGYTTHLLLLPLRNLQGLSQDLNQHPTAMTRYDINTYPSMLQCQSLSESVSE